MQADTHTYTLFEYPLVKLVFRSFSLLKELHLAVEDASYQSARRTAVCVLLIEVHHNNHYLK